MRQEETSKGYTSSVVILSGIEEQGISFLREQGWKREAKVTRGLPKTVSKKWVDARRASRDPFRFPKKLRKKGTGTNSIGLLTFSCFFAKGARNWQTACFLANGIPGSKVEFGRCNPRGGKLEAV